MQAVGLGEENRGRGFLRRRELEAGGASLRILTPPFKNQEEKGCESLRGQMLPSMHKSLGSNTSTGKTNRQEKTIFLGLAWNGSSPAAASLELRETFCFPPTGLSLWIWRADLAKGRCLVTVNPGCQCGPAAVHSLTSPTLSQPDTYSTGWKSCGEPGEGRLAVSPVGGVRGERGRGECRACCDL